MSYPNNGHDQEPVPDHLADTGKFHPIPDHLADTGRVQAIRDRDLIPAWQRAIGLLSLIGAVVLTVATIALLVLPDNADDDSPTPPTAIAQNTDQQPDDTSINEPIIQDEIVGGEVIQSFNVLPTLSMEQASNLLATPVSPLQFISNPMGAIRDIYNPFTIIPNRTRSSIETYTIATGDTIFNLAERYGLKPESIVWGNDHTIVEGLRPGRDIYILPVDGVYYQVLNDNETIEQIARRFQVEPYAIIDSDFNDLFSKRPEDTLPSGTRVVVPGGVREQISWNPAVQRVGAGEGNTGGERISFAPGEAGSCGLVQNVGGGGGWTRPLHNYTWIRGFTSYHSGVDLAVPQGTPVLAANSGSVIFAGWNSYGYGYTIVLAHGPYTTLYGHLMPGGVNVGCGQVVVSGQQIGASGTTGASSGPHLHFEIRYLDTPQDPTYTMPF